MDKYFIEIKDATLLYPSSPYNALTLKEEVFKRLRLGKPTRLVYDVEALKDVTLSVREGERVGIIGRNGAGKDHPAKGYLRYLPAPKRGDQRPRKDPCPV